MSAKTMLAREYVKQMFSDTRDADQSGSQNRAKRVRETVSDCGSDRKPRPDVFRRNFLGSGRTPPASKVHGQTGKPSFRKTSDSQEAVGVRLPCRFVDLRQVKAINTPENDSNEILTSQMNVRVEFQRPAGAK